MMMDRISLAQQIIANYSRYGWTLRRVLLRPQTRNELGSHNDHFGGIEPIDSEIDALWFARPSAAGREAWELRLLADFPYALFEAFEPDEAEEDREDARREMENRMRDYAVKSPS
jgi:hypothetical protein